MLSSGARSWSGNSSTRLDAAQAIRRGEAKISDPVSSSFTHSRSFPEHERSLYDNGGQTRNDGTWQQKNMPPPRKRGETGQGALSDSENRVSAGPSVVMSSMSSIPSKSSPSQRKSGGFRATIRRVFGSKRHRPSVTEVNKDFLHSSDPGGFMTTDNPHHFTRASPKHFASLTKSSALGSHSVTPSGAHQQHESRLSGKESPTRPQKRRNTLPSLAFSELEATKFSKSLDLYLNRSFLSQDTQDDQLALVNDKRRSRSAEALSKQFTSQDPIASDQPDRSSTITYWRNSVLMNPLPTLPDPSPDKRSPNSGLNREWTQAGSDQRPIKPVQSFDFGLGNDDEPADLEERVNTLEVKMFDFEYAIAKLQGVELPKPVLPTKNVHRRKSVHDIFPAVSQPLPPASITTSASLSASMSASSPSLHGMTFLTSPDQSPQLSGAEDDVFRPDRHSKATTIRPSTSYHETYRSDAPSPNSVRLTHSQFDMLMNLIQDEKAARQQIEMHMMDLRKEVELLQAPVYASIRPLHRPIPSPDSLTDSPVTHKVKRLHRSPRFEFNRPPNHDVSRFSMTESDADSERFQDTYETPQENRPGVRSPHNSSMISVR